MYERTYQFSCPYSSLSTPARIWPEHFESNRFSTRSLFRHLFDSLSLSIAIRNCCAVTATSHNIFFFSLCNCVSEMNNNNNKKRCTRVIHTNECTRKNTIDKPSHTYRHIYTHNHSQQMFF